jgi:magnesium transporter
VRDISNAKQEIINFRRIVRPQRVAFRDLERAMDITTPEELDVYFDDVIDASERIWDTLENYKEIIEGLESTNESVLSHNVNDILRVLTSFSVIVLPLTLVASLFGMNVLFPGEGTQEAFWVVVIIMAAMLVGLVAFFRNRGWL